MEVFPVVNTRDGAVYTAAREADRAFEIGADGVFFTDHFNGIKDKNPIFETHQSVLSKNPEGYIGINIFGAGPYEAMKALEFFVKKSDDNLPPSALWIDDMRLDGLKKSMAIDLKNSNPKLRHTKIVGGIANRHTDSYTEIPIKAEYEAEWLNNSVDVILTNGFNINGSLAVEKLTAMKKAASGKPLAVTGDFSVEDLARLDGLVNHALIKKSRENYYGSNMFDRQKLKELINLAHSLAE